MSNVTEVEPSTEDAVVDKPRRSLSADAIFLAASVVVLVGSIVFTAIANAQAPVRVGDIASDAGLSDAGAYLAALLVVAGPLAALWLFVRRAPGKSLVVMGLHAVFITTAPAIANARGAYDEAAFEQSGHVMAVAFVAYLVILGGGIFASVATEHFYRRRSTSSSEVAPVA